MEWLWTGHWIDVYKFSDILIHHLWELNWFHWVFDSIRRAANRVTTVHRVISLGHNVRIEHLLATVNLRCKLVLRKGLLAEVQVLWFKFRDSISVLRQRILLLWRYVANIVENTVKKFT